MTLTRTKYTVLILLAIQFMASVTMSMVFSLAPTISATFDLPASNATFLNIGFVGAGLLSPIFGFYADKKGTKPILIIGMFIFTLGHILAFISTSVTLYFTARFLVGLGYSAILGLIVSYLSKLLDHKHMGSTSAYLKLAFALGVFISPLMAAEIVKLTSFKFLYQSLSVISALLCLGLLWIPSVSSKHTDHLTFKELRTLFKDKTVLRFLGVSLATSLPGVVFFNFLSVFLNDNGYTQSTISSIYTMIGLGSIASAFVIFFLNKRFGMITIFRWGLWVTIAGLIPMITLSPVVIIGISVFFSLGYDTIVGLINPVLALEYPRQSGSVIMMVSLLSAVYGLLINILGPILYTQFGFMSMVLIGLISAILGTLSLHSALKRV